MPLKRDVKGKVFCFGLAALIPATEAAHVLVPHETPADTAPVDLVLGRATATPKPPPHSHQEQEPFRQAGPNWTMATSMTLHHSRFVYPYLRQKTSE